MSVGRKHIQAQHTSKTTTETTTAQGVLFVAKENIALAGLGDTYHDLPIHDAEPPIMMPTLVYKAMRAQVHQRINGPTHHTEAQTMEPIMGELK